MDFKFWGKVRTNDNLKCMDRIILFFSEFFGTFTLLFVGCMACAGSRKPLEIAFGFGMAILIAIQSFAHISGAHINPIISLAAVMRGGLPLIEFPIYLIAQFVGAICGYGMLVLISGKETLTKGNVCSHFSELEDAKAFGAEFFLSFFLVAVACSVWDYRNASNTDGISVKFGFTVAGLAAAAMPYYTGAHMNPARTFGPAVINNYWVKIWPYFIGQILGGFFAAVLYNIFFSEEDTSGKKGSTVSEEKM